MCGFGYKKKERKALNLSLYSLTHRNARTIKLVSLRVRHICLSFFYSVIDKALQVRLQMFLCNDVLNLYQFDT